MKNVARALSSISIPAFAVDGKGMVTAWNPACERMTGILAKDVLGTSRKWSPFYQAERPCLADFIACGDEAGILDLYPEAHRAELSPGGWRAEGWFSGVGGKRRYLVFEACPLFDGGRLVGAIETFQDISTHMEAHERALFLARHDRLTGLANRDLLVETLHGLVGRREFCLAAIDIDGFSEINDAFDHSFGDAVLLGMAQALRRMARPDDVVARTGGDKFAVVLTGTRDDECIEAFASNLASGIEIPVLGAHRPVRLQSCVGLALHPDHGTEPDAILAAAEAAMRCAKREGRGGTKRFDVEVSERIFGGGALLNRLRAAVPGELFLEYQPQLSMLTGAPAGAEALVRWRHPDLGVMRPDLFIPLAESGGLIGEIGTFVLEKAGDLIRRTGHKIAVNLSPLQLARRASLEAVEAVLANVPPKALTLEVTETAFLDDPAGMREALERLRAKGASIALDDFGTGHSSLANLRTLPVDYLKIDKSFVQDKKAKPIVQAVLSMAEGLGIGTIAEGVETAEQTSFLERHGCAAIQGYYYSRPIGEAPYLEFMAAKSKAGTPVPEARKVSKDPVLSWSFTFSVDYPSIDAEHKVLVALINDLHEIQPTGDSGGDLAALDSAVARLTAYVRTHFSHEESLMDLGNVPSAAKHKEQHARFVERCAAFTSHEGESGTETARRMAFFLGDWLTHHIREADLLLADELKAAWVEDPTERAA